MHCVQTLLYINHCFMSGNLRIKWDLSEPIITSPNRSRLWFLSYISFREMLRCFCSLYMTFLDDIFASFKISQIWRIESNRSFGPVGIFVILKPLCLRCQWCCFCFRLGKIVFTLQLAKVIFLLPLYYSGWQGQFFF